ncbi:unnamed protein product [Calypogeia fissa]
MAHLQILRHRGGDLQWRPLMQQLLSVFFEYSLFPGSLWGPLALSTFIISLQTNLYSGDIREVSFDSTIVLKRSVLS